MKEHQDTKLTIELVPRSAWHRNLRSMLPPSHWDKLRRDTYKRVNYKCEICGGVGPNHPIECHERWSYDDKKQVAKLTGLYGLCPACHEVKHIGLAQVKGRLPQAAEHLANVNNITPEEAISIIQDAFELWAERSEHDWDVDISWAQTGEEST